MFRFYIIFPRSFIIVRCPLLTRFVIPSAIAASIFGSQNNMIYGISIVGPTVRLKEKGIEYLIDVVVKKSKEITDKI